MEQSHISKKKVLLNKNKEHSEPTITTYVEQWNEKILRLKETTDFESTHHRNIKIIISKELKPIYIAIVSIY
jgi:hypothetical protein